MYSYICHYCTSGLGDRIINVLLLMFYYYYYTTHIHMHGGIVQLEVVLSMPHSECLALGFELPVELPFSTVPHTV